MKVFLSWSGPLSFKIATELRDWLPLVIQTLEPYVSSEDIDKGARWGIDIAKELEASTFGILCVTPENMEAPWLNFEAGALSKALEKSRVTPFLVGMRPAQLAGPLIQFQATVAQKEDVWKLVKSLNDQFEDTRLDEAKLRRGFEKFWSDLEAGIAAAIKNHSEASKEKPVRRDPAETSEEILELIRAQHRMITDLSAQLSIRSVPMSPSHFDLTGLPDGTFRITRGNNAFVIPAKTAEAVLLQEGVPKRVIQVILAGGLEPGETMTFPVLIKMSALQRLAHLLEGPEDPQPPRPPQPPQPPAKGFELP
jgi:hypothetical protein